MTQPMVFVWRMVGFLAFVLVVAVALFDQQQHAFAANPVLNSVILAVLLFGIGWNLRQVVSLRHEVAWIEGFRSARGGCAGAAAVVGADGVDAVGAAERTRVAVGDRAAVGDGRDRLAPRREPRAVALHGGAADLPGAARDVLGLLLTIGSVADVIGGMSVGSGDLNALFNQLKTGLARPLEGMGTAFSTSMLGLAGRWCWGSWT